MAVKIFEARVVYKDYAVPHFVTNYTLRKLLGSHPQMMDIAKTQKNKQKNETPI